MLCFRSFLSRAPFQEEFVALLQLGAGYKLPFCGMFVVLCTGIARVMLRYNKVQKSLRSDAIPAAS